LSLRTRLADLLAREHPDEAAAELERLPPERVADFLSRQPPAGAADLLRRLDPRFAVRAAEPMDAATLAAAVDTLALDVAARLVRRLPDALRDAALAELEPARSRPLRRLLEFPENTAGALLDPEVLALAEDATARDARPLYQIDYRGRSVTSVETATGVLVWAEGAGDSQRLTQGADGTAVWQRRLRQAPPRQVTRRMQCRGAMQ